VWATMTRMTNAQPPIPPASGPGPTRVGNIERQQAMDALDVHLEAGRLDPEEYGERFGKASVARTTADLEPLFADLPEPHGSSGISTTATPARPVAAATGAAGWTAPEPAPRLETGRRDGRDRRDRHRSDRGEPMGGRLGQSAAAASPFVALILFLATKNFFDAAWVFFLLVPLTGALVYGHKRDHGR
jgi:Domain of unknown function (DUF1707)